VVRLCNCSAANEAEYFTTHAYSLPCTTAISVAADSVLGPGWQMR
jgi:hypothetical protein